MTHTVHCAKLNKTLPGLAKAPYPGELGQKIYQSISQDAWKMWLEHQTILINEYRLNLMDPKSRAMLAAEMESFLFSDGGTKPDAFIPPAK